MSDKGSNCYRLLFELLKYPDSLEEVEEFLKDAVEHYKGRKGV